MTKETIPASSSSAARTIKRGILAALLFFACCLGYAFYDAASFLRTSAAMKASVPPQDVVVDVAPGATFDRVARDLYKAGAVSNVFRFRLLAKVRGKLGAVQVGEFCVNTGWTPEKILGHITSGNQILYRLSLREGLPWWETARLVEAGGFARADEFAAVIHDPEFLRRNGIPFPNAEGFLYPETYLLRKPRTLGGRQQAEAVANILVETFWKRSWPHLTRIANTAAQTGGPVPLPDHALRNNAPVRIGSAGDGRTHASPGPLRTPFSKETLRRLIILASLVEKETGVPEERARVAGVYANRLRIGMPLQCDPTIIYGLGQNQNGPIRRSQLDDAKNPYNTYKHPGLPPGPICSPGAASIQAAAKPENHKFLYFVATGDSDGAHTFSTNLNDHNRAVRVYRAAQR